MAHTELNLRERRTIEDMLNAKISVREIAAEIGRHVSTVYREIKRNHYDDKELPELNGYYGMVAQRSAAQRRARRRKLVRLFGLRKAVITQLKEGWSPEQIAGRLQFEGQTVRVSHETIYAYVYGPDGQSRELARYLNSYSRQHALYQTLKAFGQIIKSLFILRYVDDLSLRQAIERQLNKVELANRFTRAVAVGNPREFTQAEKEEQEIAEACNRLIKNSIICWNYLYLAHQLERVPDEETRENLRRTIAAHAPMAWAHINMLGEYDFSDDKLRDALGILPLKSAA